MDSHRNPLEAPQNSANFLRGTISVLSLAIFNLFMVVPAIVYSALLVAIYASALAFYVAGIALTASGLSGANELLLDGPLRHFAMNDEAFSNLQTKVSISDGGIHVFQEPVTERALPISTAPDSGWRIRQTFFGIGMVLGGIILFLISLVVTKYTLIGIKRYIDMNFSLLKGGTQCEHYSK